MPDIEIPDFSLTILVGASGSGKTTFASRNFRGGEALSSDAYRVMVRDGDDDAGATPDAFEAMEAVASLRLRARRPVCIDATNLDPAGRRRWHALADRWHAPRVAIVFDASPALLRERLDARPDRDFDPKVLRSHAEGVRQARAALRKEGWKDMHVVPSAEAGAHRVVRRPLRADMRAERGPFDVVGDVHGCCDELEELLAKLGYAVSWHGEGHARRAALSRPSGDARRLCFVGDLVDRGPRSLDALRIAMAAVAAGGIVVPGNHDDKFSRWLRKRPVTVNRGLETTVAEMAAEPGFARDAEAFLSGLPSHAWLDGGALVLAHAGIEERYVGRASARIRDFCLYGDPSGEDAEGMPVRRDWAASYQGVPAVAYGHVPSAVAEWVNGTVCIDTGCAFGGALSALRWPERELVSVPARRAYAQGGIAPPRASGRTGQAEADMAHDPDLADLVADRSVGTALVGKVRLAAPALASALGDLTSHCVDPRWLAFVPPTMSPCDTSRDPSLMERPAEALSHYRGHVDRVVLEGKHMGSRAVAVVCRDEGTALRRFGVLPAEGPPGSIHTRHGRPFFPDPGIMAAEVDRLRAGLDADGFWDRHGTGWAMLDCEVLPWSAKAGGLVRDTFVPVSANGGASLAAARAAFAAAAARGVGGAGDVAARLAGREARVAAYGASWRAHVAAEPGERVRYAVFHVLAVEGSVPALDRSHADFHMAEGNRLAEASDTFVGTPFLALDPSDPDAPARADAFWRGIIDAGGEGVVAKPDTPAVLSARGLLQPALKVRGPEYLRIVYGPEYDDPANLPRLRDRNVSPRRARALREFALGMDGLSRFVAGDPLRLVTERVLATLAMGRERDDPRL